MSKAEGLRAEGLRAEPIAEARALVCSAIADLGGVCERLRELEEMPMREAVAAESWQDVENWVTEACETLGMITTIAAKARGEEEVGHE